MRTLSVGDGAGWVLIEVGSKFVVGRVDDGGFDEEETDPGPPDGATDPPEGPDDEPGDDEEGGPEGLFLCPCYEIHRGMGQDAKGRQGLVTNAVPYGLMAHDCRVMFVPIAVTELSDMAPSDREMFKQLIAQAEQFKTEMRASRAGISLVQGSGKA